MRVGSRVRLTEEIVMWGKLYDAGHEFIIYDEDYIRGFSLVDDDGNKVDECRMIHHLLEEIPQKKKDPYVDYSGDMEI